MNKTKTTNSTTFDFAVGIIETTGLKEKSKAIFFDEKLNIVREKNVNYAGLGSRFVNPIYQGGSVYYFAKGMQKKGIGNDVVGFDLKNAKVSEYKLDCINIQSIAVTEDKIIAVSNINGPSYLTIHDKHKNKLKEVRLDETYLTLVVVANNKIFAFSTKIFEDEKATMFIFDMELNELSKKDILHVGRDSGKYCIMNNKIYYSSDDASTYALGIVDLDTGEVERVELKEKWPHDVIKVNENQLLISHTMPAEPIGNKIGLYDIATKTEAILDMGEIEITMIAYVKDILYVLAYDAYKNIAHIISYEIKGMGVQKLNETKYETTSPYTYISALFGNLQE